ncbi:MAG: hypothetical protein GXO17_01085 [Thermodesulfobacteria bacterium]|nr:hypothetical protein [Thermodesulfobacteriota bacterium]
MRTFKGLMVLGFLGALLVWSSAALSAGPGSCGAALAGLVCQGEPVTLKGTIVGGVRGQGMIFDTGGEKVTVRGLGPMWYWREIGVAKPRLGDSLEISGYRVQLQDGQEVIVAKEVVLQDGHQVSLRDDSCYPVWIKR